MRRALVLAVVAGCALAALALVAWRSGRAARPEDIRPETGSKVSAVLAPAAQTGPVREDPAPEDGIAPPVRVAVLDPSEAEPDPSPRGDGLVVEGGIYEERINPAEDKSAWEPRRSSGRVRYMPVGALLGRTLIEQELVDVEEFTSEPLLSGEWIVEVRVPGFQPDVECAWLFDEDYDCFVSLRRGVDFEFDVRLPDGTQPARALFAFALRDPRETRRAFVPRSDEVFQSATCLWTPAEPRVCVVVDDPENAMDLIFVAEPTGESPYDARAPSRYVSNSIAVDPRTDAPIRVQLRAACSLQVSVVGPERPILEHWRWVRAVRLDGCEGFDAEALLAASRTISDWPPALLARAEFDWFSHGSRWDADETFSEHSLLPGRWLVAAGWGDEPASIARVVEVDPGLTEVALTLGQPPTSARLCARFVVAGEFVPEPEMKLSFALAAAGPDPASRGVGENSVSGLGGRWFERGELVTAQRELSEELHVAVPVHLVAWGRQFNGQRAVFVSAPLSASTGECVLEELARTELHLHVAHTSKRRITLELEARLSEPTRASQLVLSAVPEPFDPVQLHVGLSPRQHERKLRVRLLPGRWRFDVHVSSAPMVKLEPIEVEIRGGPQEFAVTLPELFDVTVVAQRAEAGSGVRLRRLEQSSAAKGDGAELRALLDSSRRAVFEGLPAGHYVVSDGAGSAPLHIVVPCGEVLYEPRRWDAFEVRLAPLEDGSVGVLARAGFQSGDVLLDFNGRDLREQADLDALLEAIEEHEVTVRMRRGVQTLQLRLGPMPDPRDPGATCDAEFERAWR